MKNSSSDIPMLGRRALALLMLLWLATPLAAQEDNLARLRECARAVADSVTGELASGGRAGDTICASVVNHQAAWLLDQAMVEASGERNMPIVTCEPSAASVTMAITSIGVLYGELDDPDRIERVAELQVSATLPTGASGNNGRAVRIYSVTRRDTVDADRTSSIERSGYEFTRGSFPARNAGGFWKKLVEPAVVLGASVVMVVLLFTVRSR